MTFLVPEEPSWGKFRFYFTECAAAMSQTPRVMKSVLLPPMASMQCSLFL